ncbi:PH domain-containing protein [Isoptericola sp. NPDC019693]|uniref:PH domain-containing protein n=1 Tax=Isoptericola sp. NPDC019693 TaxID=3364009 RepID=UPI0037B4365D
MSVAAGVSLRPPRHRYGARVVHWWRSRLLLVTAAVLVPLVVLGAAISPARAWLLGGAGVVALAGGVTAVLLPVWWHRVHRWEVTEDAVYTRTGYVWQSWRIVPMSRIQTVDTTRGPVQRVFGLATVRVTTASAAGDVTIAGLHHHEAEAVAHELARRTDATPADAT